MIFEDVLQAPDGLPLDIAVHQGKVVVLEFWATWCKPCIESIPHLNQLAAQFDQDVIFIAVTDEPRATVEPKLDKLNIHSWIACDTDRSVFKNFNVTGLPHTVIIDADGVVAGITSPHHLTSEKLSRVVRGERAEIGGPYKQIAPGFFDWELTADPGLPRAEIRSSSINENTNFQSEQDRLTGMANSALSYAMWAWDTGRGRIRTEEFDAPWSDLFDIAVIVPSGDESDLKAAVQRLLQSRLGLIIEWENIETSTLVLRQSDDLRLKLIKQAQHSDETSNTETTMDHEVLQSNKRFLWNRRTVKGDTLESLRQYIEDFSWLPVIDETGLDGFYSWSLELAYTDRQDKAPIVARELGLLLTNEQRSVPMLVIKPGDPD